MNLSSDSFLMVHHGMTCILGSLITSGILAALRAHRTKLIYIGKLPEDGWFYITQDKLASVTAISERKTVRKHTQRLEDLGLVKTKLEGLPQRLFYFLNDDIYDTLNGEGTKSLWGIDKDLLTDNQSGNDYLPGHALNTPCSKKESEKEVFSKLQKKPAFKKQRPSRIEAPSFRTLVPCLCVLATSPHLSRRGCIEAGIFVRASSALR